MLVTEDRFLNSYPSRGGVPIATLPELVSGMRREGEVQDSEYFDIILRLRRGNARYLPMEAAEITFHLRDARITDGQVVETTALTVLRRYVAGIVGRFKWLRHPERPAESNGEAAFVIGLRRAVLECVRAAWEGEVSEGGARARSAWVMANLFYPFHMLYRRARGDTNIEYQEFAALDLASLVLEGLRLGTENGGPRQKYLTWVGELVDKAMTLEPTVIDPLARIVKDGFRSALLAAERAGSRAHGALFLRGAYDDLPAAVSGELQKDAEFLTEIGIEVRAVVAMGPLVFTRDAFFSGAECAVNGAHALVELEGGRETVEFCPASTLERRPTFTIVRADNQCFVQGNERLLVLSSDEARARDALKRHPEWLEGCGLGRANCESELLGLPPRRRIERLEDLVRSSASLFYAQLEEGLRRQPNITFSTLLSLSQLSILRYFGLFNHMSASSDYEAAGQELCEMYGVAQAFIRLSALPIPMPDGVLYAVGRVNDKELGAIVRSVLSDCPLPLSCIHLVRLLHAVSGRTPVYARLARRLVRSLVTDESVERLGALMAALRWVWDSFARAGLAESPIAAWGHAGMIVSALLRAGAKAAWIRTTFGSWADRVPVGTFAGRRGRHLDLADPWRQRPERLLLTGLAYALDDAADVKARCRPALEAFFGQAIGTIRAPRTGLLCLGPQGPNTAGTFLDRPYLECFRDLCAAEGEPVLGVGEANALVANAIGRLEESVYVGEAWIALTTLTGHRGPEDPEAVRVILGSVDVIDLVELHHQAADGVLSAMDVIGRVLAMVDDHGRSRNFMKLLVGFAAFYCAPGVCGDVDDRYLPEIVNLGALIAPGREGAERASEYGKFLEQLAGVAPRWSDTVRRVQERLATQLRGGEALEIWPCVARMREG